MVLSQNKFSQKLPKQQLHVLIIFFKLKKLCSLGYEDKYTILFLATFHY